MIITKHLRKFLVAGSVVTLSFMVQQSHAQADPLYHYEQLDGTNPKNAARSSNSSEPSVETANRKSAPPLGSQSIPLDGGLSLFLIAGAGIAAKKRYDLKKAKA